MEEQMAKVSINQLASYAVEQLEKGVSSEAVSKHIAAYLLDARQSRELPKVLRAVEVELNRRGSSQVVITSAHAVSEAVKKELASILGAKNPVFYDEIDPSVIGGVKARSGESEIDLTVRGRLQRFKATIVKN